MNLLNEKQLRIVGPILLFLGGTLFFRLNWYLELSVTRMVRSDLIALGAGYLCWNLNRWVMLRLQKRYPGSENTRRRILLMALLMPFLVNFAWLIRQVAHVAFNNETQISQSIPDYTYAIGIQVFYHFIYFIVYEGGYVLRTWRQTYERNERLKKNKLQTQLDTLKSQINPHFLFNSLNSLSSLISENPVQADAFLEELTAVFRYLLQASERQVVPLRDELTFMRSYSHLLQTRYQQGVVFDMTIDPSYESLLMPPLALQVLVENAVRYNLILPEKPLRINIYTDAEQRLNVANTLQLKTLRVDTGGTNLGNLATQYSLLGQQELLIKEQPDWFIVSLPLLREEILDAGA